MWCHLLSSAELGSPSARHLGWCVRVLVVVAVSQRDLILVQPLGCAASELCCTGCTVRAWVCMLCALERCLVRMSECYRKPFLWLEAAGFGKVVLRYVVWWMFHLLSLPRADRKFREGAHAPVRRTKAGCWSFLTSCYSWSAASISAQWTGRLNNPQSSNMSQKISQLLRTLSKLYIVLNLKWSTGVL